MANDALCHNDFRADRGEECAFTSRLRFNAGGPVNLCSWCGRFETVDPRPPPRPEWIEAKARFDQARRRRRRDRERDRDDLR